ncbi:zinc metalloprotease [Thermococcus gorgonarius]|uniref:Metalloprotease n=1 Tax=Thermococcus gorgonarius TaxID=71997 RepID=A0A2Z2M966_THEGO|nr:metalloprotease [Thermococcus gorgonarius]ASJ01035.1 metalloprotease [Thermococcus gorgonarius]
MNYREFEDLTLSFFVLTLLFSNFELKNVPYAGIAVLLSFVFHELAHKHLAGRYGFIAYYRRWDLGIILAIIIGILSRFLTGETWIFAALGALQIRGLYTYHDPRAFGKIAAAGPLTNLLLGVAGVALLYALPLSGWALKVVYFTSSVNLWVAFFNLWPIPPLDGWKVMRWNVAYWAIMIGVAYTFMALL